MLLLSPQAHAQYDWLQFGFLPDRTGNNTLETKITLGNVGSLQSLFTAPLSFNPDGAPVLLTGVTTPSGVRDLVFIFAEQGYTTAYDANTGAQVWTVNYSTGAADSGGPVYPAFCAGHTSNTAPAIDPNRLYVYTFGMDGNVHKLNVGDGSEVTGGGWPERIMNDDGKARGPLSIATAANGHTYLYGNASHGEGNMTTIDLGTGTQHVFNTANAEDPDTHSPSGGSDGANPWSRGPAYNAALDRVFFPTGTYANFSAGHNWAESLLGMAPDGSTNIISGGGYPVDSYTPTAWQTDINNDSDLGSSTIIQLPTGLSSKYPNLGVIGSKDSQLRILNLANLSGQGAPGKTGGELQQISNPAGGAVRSQGTTWTNPANGNVWVFIPCDNGISGLQVAIDGSGNPTLVTKWTLKNGWTTSAIMANGVLFAAVGGGEHTDTTSTHHLQAINPTTGAVVWSASIGQFHWASPIVANGIVYMTDGNSGGFGTGTDGNLHAWNLPGGGGGGSFTLAPSSGSLSVAQGSSATDTIGVTEAGGFTGSVTLSNSTLPSGVTAGFGTNPTTGSSVLTLTASSSATVGTSTVTIKGVSGSLTASTNIALTVTTGSSNLIANGTYVIESVYSGLAIDDPGGSKTAGEDMQIYTVNNGASQQWTVNNLGNNVITLRNGASGDYLDVAGASKASKALVDQWTSGTAANQHWNVISLGGGHYELTNVNSGLALNIVGGSKTVGANLDQYPYAGSAWQQWSFQAP